MDITFSVSDEIVKKIGENSIRKELEEIIEMKKLIISFENLSKKVKKIQSHEYFHNLENIREEAWKEYKLELEK